MPKSTGQALLIVLLVMAVVLTIALSVVSRSVTDISIAKKEDDAARAFSAAEAGIERTLTSGAEILTPETLQSGGKFTTTIQALASGGRDFVIPLYLSSGETAPIWLVAHNPSGVLECSGSNQCYTGNEMKVCWGLDTQANTPTTPALEMSIIYTTGDSYSTARVARLAYDPNNTRGNNFDSSEILSGCSISGTNFAFSKTFTLASIGVTVRSSGNQTRGPQMIRARLIYNTDKAHPVGIQLTDNSTLPRQGSKIESTGTAQSAARKIEVYQLYPDLPPVFDFSVFAGTGGLVK